jgi:diadenylate cyclase
MIGITALGFAKAHWRDALEITLLWALVYQTWKRLRETQGIRILSGVILGALGILLLSKALHLPVLDWLLRNVAALSLFALVVIFQPELRRAAVTLGNNRLFSLGKQNPETVEILGELTFDLANRQLGALIAIERDLPLDSWAESGVELDSSLSVELVVTIFHPKTPLHDGGLILRADRLLSGACIFPITQRLDLDRNLGLRHRAGLGLSEETDALIIVVSEETGVVSLCHDGAIERDFDPKSFKARLGELLSLSGNEAPAE